MPGRERAKYLYRIARIIQERSRELAVLESLDNGKPIKESRDVDLPLAAAHFFYYAGWADKLDYAFPGRRARPLGVAGQVIPWNFPLLMAAWKLAPALAAGNAVVLKPAGETPASIMKLMEVAGDLLPDGVLNVVNGHGAEAGKPLALSPRIAIFLPDVLAADDEFLDKAIEGFVMFAFNQGEVCTCPSRALVHESIYNEFLARAQARVEAIVGGDPLDPTTQIGAQASRTQLEKILRYIDVGRAEGATVRTGGSRRSVSGRQGGYYVEPTILEGANDMRVFQEEIFGPVVSVTSFRDLDHALEIANDTLYGLGAGVWSRDANDAYRLARGIQAGRVWVNNYHAYPAHAAFGGYKQSGIGRETHKMMLSHYQQTKNVLVSYSPRALGLF
jgi:aldehyde dehydrogenase